jgi:hypothetical protein
MRTGPRSPAADQQVCAFDRTDSGAAPDPADGRSLENQALGQGSELAVLVDGPWVRHWYWRRDLEKQQAAARYMFRRGGTTMLGTIAGYVPTERFLAHPDETYPDGRVWVFREPTVPEGRAPTGTVAEVARPISSPWARASSEGVSPEVARTGSAGIAAPVAPSGSEGGSNPLTTVNVGAAGASWRRPGGCWSRARGPGPTG